LLLDLASLIVSYMSHRQLLAGAVRRAARPSHIHRVAPRAAVRPIGVASASHFSSPVTASIRQRSIHTSQANPEEGALAEANKKVADAEAVASFQGVYACTGLA